MDISTISNGEVISKEAILEYGEREEGGMKEILESRNPFRKSVFSFPAINRKYTCSHFTDAFVEYNM